MTARKRPPRCPRCQQTPLDYVEMWSEFSITFTARADGWAEEEGWHGPAGNPTHVIARCRCGHKWRLRGVLQITELQPEVSP